MALPAHGEPLDFASAIERVRSTHPDAMAARARALAARARVGVALSTYLPQIGVAALGRGDYSNFAPVVVGTPQTGTSSTTFPFQGSLRYSAALNANQLLFDGGQTLSAIAAARARQAAAEGDAAATLLTLEGAAAAAFFGTLEAERLLAVAHEYEALNRSLVESVQHLVKAGIRPEFDALSAETRQQRATLDRVRAEGLLAQRRAALLAALGEERDPGYTLVDAFVAPIPEEGLALERAVEQALADRPDLRTLVADVRAAEAEVRAVRGAYAPTVSLGLSALLTGNSQVPGPLYNFFGFLTLEEDLFSGLATYRQGQAARQALAAARSALASARAQVRANVAITMAALVTTRTADEAAEALVAQATRMSQAAQRRYDSGLLSLLELMDAYVQRTQAQAQRVSARYALALSRADLRRALGAGIEAVAKR